MSIAPIHLRPSQGRPLAAWPPARIVDWGIKQCYAIAVRHNVPPITGGYLHSPPALMPRLAEQIRVLKAAMTALAGPVDAGNLKAAVTGLADVNVDPDRRTRDLEAVGAALRDEGITAVALDRHGNSIYAERMVEFDIEGGRLYVLLQPERDSAQMFDGRVVRFPDLRQHPRAVEINMERS